MREQKLDSKIFEDALKKYLQTLNVETIVNPLIGYIAKSKKITYGLKGFEGAWDVAILMSPGMKCCIANAIYHDMKKKYGSFMSEFSTREFSRIFHKNYKSICDVDEDGWITACKLGLHIKLTKTDWQEDLIEFCDGKRKELYDKDEMKSLDEEVGKQLQKSDVIADCNTLIDNFIIDNNNLQKSKTIMSNEKEQTQEQIDQQELDQKFAAKEREGKQKILAEVGRHYIGLKKFEMERFKEFFAEILLDSGIKPELPETFTIKMFNIPEIQAAYLQAVHEDMLHTIVEDGEKWNEDLTTFMNEFDDKIVEAEIAKVATKILQNHSRELFAFIIHTLTVTNEAPIDVVEIIGNENSSEEEIATASLKNMAMAYYHNDFGIINFCKALEKYIIDMRQDVPMESIDDCIFQTFNKEVEKSLDCRAREAKPEEVDLDYVEELKMLSCHYHKIAKGIFSIYIECILKEHSREILETIRAVKIPRWVSPFKVENKVA